MRQHAILFAAILLLAAMLNVAVAWSCALLAPRELGGADYGIPNEAIAFLLGRDYAHQVAFRYHGWGVSDDVYLATDFDISTVNINVFVQALDQTCDIAEPTAAVFTDDRNVPTVTAVRAGWPMRAMAGWRVRHEGPRGYLRTKVKGRTSLVSATELVAQACVRPRRLVPLRPLWLGSLVNTLLYGASLGLIVRGLLELHETISREPGICPECGYDLRHADHAACPECGRRRDAAVS